ncbi:hypothetical protein MBRU_02145 [Mycolicibacterium brumae DSM 44177]|nr:hypothetical protein MBRU_02145 [Mycolicibacterium brumae DSM 44177]
MATEIMRMELPDSLVIEVVPGPVDTPVQAEVRLIPGTGEMLDRFPVGDAGTCAKRIIKAIEHGRRTVVYPREYAPALAFPTIGRRFLRWRTRNVRLGEVILRTGSHGDPEAQAARRSWTPRQHAS